MSRSALTGATVVTPDGLQRDAAVLVENGVITGITPGDAIGDAGRVVLDGGYLVPGFIDIQVNGGGGVLFNDETSVEGIHAIAAAHRRFGTTALLPTLISDTPDKIGAAIAAVDAAIDAGVPGVIGLHIEGPYLNTDKRGIHDPALIASLDEKALVLLTRPGRGKRLVTIAPECAPPGTIRRLREAGVIVCAGHSTASYEQTRAALDEGLDGFTHLFNAMTQLGAREPGMVGAALEHRRSRFGLIVDGHHVHPAVMRVAVGARGLDGVMLVTDAMSSIGSDQTAFALQGREIHVADGMLRGDDGTLAGAHLDMATALRNARDMLGLDLAQASQAASGNAAAFLGLLGERGRIAPGTRADLVHLDDDLQVRQVWIAGERADG